MAAVSNYLANKLLDHINGKTSFTMPTNVYIALTTTVPTAATAGTEVTTGQYTGYTRSTVAIAAGMAAASSGSSTNSGAVIAFPACTGGTGATVVGWQAYDATTAGNPLHFGTCSLSVSSGITPSFATSAFTVTMT
jgi:hypothetical protein